jgi:hypothetical protein
MSTRTCSITHESMGEGWCWGDGAFYTKYEKDTLAECRKDKEEILKMADELDWEMINDIDNIGELENAAINESITDAQLLEVAYGVDYLYWTTWFDDGEDEDL